MDIYLVRHGQAKKAEEDSARPLNAVGIKQIESVARVLKKSSSVHVAEIYHSTKLRARQTAEHLAQALDLRVPLKEVSYLEPDDHILKAVELIRSSGRSIMLVGHLPFLDNLATFLVSGNKDGGMFEFREGAVLCLNLLQAQGQGSALSGYCCRVRWMVTPEISTPL